MKSGLRLFMWLLLTAMITTACGNDANEVPTDQPQGPALVMFYTEG